VAYKNTQNILNNQGIKHIKNTSKTLEISRKVDLEDCALKRREGTKINKVWEKVPCIYDTFAKKVCPCA